MTKAIYAIMISFSLFSVMVTGQSIYSPNLLASLKDSDNDGVIDARDLCANTKLGRDIDHNGCPIAYLEFFHFAFDVQFDSNKHQLKPEFHPKLENLAFFLQEYPETIILIEGHTDNLGSSQHNKTLSKARAESIGNALTSVFAINKNRIKTFGLGEEYSIASNETEEGKKANRRVIGEIITPLSYDDSDNKSIIISFEKNQRSITLDNHPNLKSLGDFLKQNPNTLIIIEGHTDNSGNQKLNMAVSTERANNIAKILNTQLSINESRIKVLGHGGSFPLSTNNTEKGRQKNRRVEITIASRFKAHKKVSLPKWTIWNIEEGAQ